MQAYLNEKVPAKVLRLKVRQRLALPQPATMAVWQKMSEVCHFRCQRHERCCANPKKVNPEQDTGSCQFVHCPLMEDIINAK
jgi:hypothetical protein